ncbi:MAG: hypothetical protein ACOVP6_00390 [Lacibacter sp.]
MMLLIPLAIQTTIVEIILFQGIALIIGFVIHYLWSIRNGGLEASELDLQKQDEAAQKWRLKYYEYVEQHQQEQDELQAQLQKAKEREKQLLSQLDTMQATYEQAAQHQQSKPEPVERRSGDFLTQLKKAQDHLNEQNESIQKLLQQVETAEQSEERFQELEAENESLQLKIHQLTRTLREREDALNRLQEQSDVAEEMKRQLEYTYEEFNALQDRLHKVEKQFTQPTSSVLRYEDLEEANSLLKNEVQTLRLKNKELVEEISLLNQSLLEAEDQYREAGFQQQQLDKKIAYLEQLNQNLQEMTQAEKKLETQMNRLAQLEKVFGNTSGNSNDQGH